MLKEQKMKLTKLSLAAIVAVGALGSFSSATPLEEAIKGVEVSGIARYRAYVESDTTGSGSANGGRDGQRFSGVLNVLTPVTDSLKFSAALYSDNWDNAGELPSDAGGTEINKFFFQYGANDLTVKAGKFEIPTPWTQSAVVAGSRGNGALALYSGIEGWTLAGAAYLQTNGLNNNNVATFDSQKNLYALAVIGKIADAIGLQIWAANFEKTIDATVFGEVSYAAAGFNVKGQVNYLKPDDTISDKSGLFLGIAGGYKGQSGDVGFNVNAGFTYTNKDLVAYALDGDNDGFIQFGKQLYYKSVNKPDTQVLFAKGGVSVDKFGFELGFGAANDGIADDTGYEGYGTVTYKYAKNFGLELYYSVLDGDLYDSISNNEIRFQAQYNF
jgi:hypothetical protein